MVWFHAPQAYASILYRQLPEYFRIILRGRDIEYHNIAEDLKYVQFIKYMPQVDGNLEVCAVYNSTMPTSMLIYSYY